ncbi:MAG: Asp-tRNA(Asn)/Glu-tRNA(Gln) amidotransferase subunit GatC [Desulforudis sp.]|nr:MAG: Asp-tRNA(Asn)/Glu-tRNA(Gln) amidotransferase subunit GatC [Desulforudis sp.]
MLSREVVDHVALLARLELSEEEKERYASQLADILEYAERLQELDTEDVIPTAHVLPLQNVFRHDTVGQHLPSEETLANAPDREDNCFKVPRII